MARMKLAWVYATHPDASARDAAKAKQHLDKIGDDYIDRVTLNETRAVVSAESNAFDNAVAFQQAALKEAQSWIFRVARSRSCRRACRVIGVERRGGKPCSR